MRMASRKTPRVRECAITRRRDCAGRVRYTRHRYRHLHRPGATCFLSNGCSNRKSGGRIGRYLLATGATLRRLAGDGFAGPSRTWGGGRRYQLLEDDGGDDEGLAIPGTKAGGID